MQSNPEESRSVLPTEEAGMLRGQGHFGKGRVGPCFCSYVLISVFTSHNLNTSSFLYVECDLMV
jgi:hypothetical protein